MDANKLIKKYPKGSIITHTWSNGRYIIIVDKPRNDNSHIVATYGLNASNILRIGCEFGCLDEECSFRFANQKERQELFDAIIRYLNEENNKAIKSQIVKESKIDINNIIANHKDSASRIELLSYLREVIDELIEYENL